MASSRLITTIAGAALATGLTLSQAAATDWGCEVLLCLSNPGGPMQYAACVPPITQLYDVLRSGGSFPTCSGVGFKTSQPRFEPYYCEAGATLTQRGALDGSEFACVSNDRIEVEPERCSGEERSPTAQLLKDGGQSTCTDFETTPPLMREQPHYVDVTIEGQGTQRVRY